MQPPILSIVIPTRNRQKFCIAAIENILSYDYPDMELCIQDNSDDDTIARHLSGRKPDSRLKYHYTPEQLNSVHNIDRAVGMAVGKYVIMIGDDDTILPEVFKTAEWAAANNKDSVCSLQNVAYYWPGVYPGQSSGVLTIITPAADSLDEKPITWRLDRLFAKGITRFLDYKLPKLYHGLIRRECLQEIHKKTGHYFGGLSPDIYSTIALCGIVCTHTCIDRPISIFGACRSSSTSQNIHLGHRGELSTAPHLILRGPYVWDDYVPAYYSVETIWAESALKAVREMGMDHLLKKFNFSYLVAFAALNNRNMFRFAMEKSLSPDNYFIRTGHFIRLRIGYSLIRVSWEYALRNMQRKMHMGAGQTQTYYNIDHISQAVKTYLSTCSQ